MIRAVTESENPSFLINCSRVVTCIVRGVVDTGSVLVPVTASDQPIPVESVGSLLGVTQAQGTADVMTSSG